MVSAIGYADSMSTDEDTRLITSDEVRTVARAMLDAASTVSLLVMYDPTGTVRDSSVARLCRAAADFLAAMHKAASPSILRRAADRIDPPTVPAEPDLTTPEGWIAEAKRCVVDAEGVDAFGWTSLPRAKGDELYALADAWHRASEPHCTALAHNYVRSIQA